MPIKHDNDKETGQLRKAPEDPASERQGSIGINIIGDQKTGKNETRLFQTAVDTKEYLTKDEAEGKGFYWKD